MSTAPNAGASGSCPGPVRLSAGPRRALAGLELVTGFAGLVGGALLAAAPDGSLLHADLEALADSPFRDWRVPGVLLAGLVGGGFVLSGLWQWRGRPGARGLSAVAGIGLVGFESAELAWLGFQPLEAMFALIGVAVTALALPGPVRGRPRPPTGHVGRR